MSELLIRVPTCLNQHLILILPVRRQGGKL